MDNDILKNVADASTDKPVIITVDIFPQNRLHRFLLENKLIKNKRTFELRCVKMGTLIKISRLLLTIDITFFNKEKLLESNFIAADKYAETLAECVALAIHNRKSEVPRSLVSFILTNFSTAELCHVLMLVIKQMDVSNFMTSIISIRGVNILANPTASVPNAK